MDRASGENAGCFRGQRVEWKTRCGNNADTAKWGRQEKRHDAYWQDDTEDLCQAVFAGAERAGILAPLVAGF